MAGQRSWLVLTACLVVASLHLIPSSASARSFRVGQVPNGGGFGCGLCHANGNGGARNRFGSAVEETLVDGDVNWAAVFDGDPDGDGFTNGEELGDPDGTWRIGDPPPRVAPTNPNDPGSFPTPCGNGVIEDEEQCDVGDLDGADCASLGFLGGELGCALDCSYDTSDCSNCGNAFQEGDEECDGDDLADATCQTLGFGSGTLSCTPGCTLDASACSDCGDGVRDGGEQCDGDDLDGQTCISRGYDGGELVCTDGCELDTAACEGDPTLVCGDGIQSGDEECDGDDLAGQDCGSLMAGEGALMCRVDCTFDVSDCREPEPEPEPEPDVGIDSGAEAPDVGSPDPDTSDAGEPAPTEKRSENGSCATPAAAAPAWSFTLLRPRGR